MKSSSPSLSSSRPGRKVALFAAVVAVALDALASTALATDYYWRGTGSDTWENRTKWTTGPSSGGSPSAFLPTDTFIVGTPASALNTSYTTGSTFPGGTLRLDDGGVINLRVSGTNNAVITHLVTTGGGRIAAAFSDTRTALIVNSFDNSSGVTLLDTGSGTSLARNLTLEIGTLTGSGGFAIKDGSNTLRTLYLSATDATAYTGDFNFTLGTINFDNDLVSGGSLTLSGTAVVTLDQSVTFASVTVAGTALSAGFHSFADLNTAYDAFFTDGGSGGITVGAIPEPSSLALLAGGAALLGTLVRRRRRRRA